MFLAKDWLQGWCWLGEKMVEEQEELVRRARETLRDSITRQGVEVIM